jgi:RNA polymerase sigma-70 factor, ECF subfamily
MNPAELEAYAPLTDADIVARVRSGETALFEVIMRRHNQRLFRAARAIVRNDTEAEDVMQESYVLSYEHLAQFEGRASLATWLTRIAVNEALGRLRRGRRVESIESTRAPEAIHMVTPSSTSPEQETSDRELCALLERAVDRLSEDARTVFVLRAVEGMSGAETAECLGITEENVKTRLHRARASIQENLIDHADRVAPKSFAFHLARCDRVVAAVLARIGAPAVAGRGAQ